MKSRGTKETQGINGDAAALQRWMDAGADAGLPASSDPCQYLPHRQTDWIRGDRTGPLTCGACHPPAAGGDAFEVVRRGEARFADLVAAAAARVIRRDRGFASAAAP